LREEKPPHPTPLLHKYVEEREKTRDVFLHEPAARPEGASRFLSQQKAV
jgi:hypothetical protein